MSIEVLDPTHETGAPPFEPAERLASLAGKTVCIISNGKRGTRAFFEALERELRERFGVGEVLLRIKPNYSAPAGVEMIREAAGWDALISGVGD